MTPFNQSETWYVVNAGFLKALQHEAARQVASMSPEAVAQARGSVDNFVARSKQRLEQHSQLQQPQQLQQLQQHLRIENASLLAPESAKRSFATKRTRLADGVEKRMGQAFQVCDAVTWTVLSAWVPHDIEVPRGVYVHSGRLHVEVQPLLFHAFKAIGSCASCKEAVTEPVGDFVASRADTLDLVIHKLKEIAGVEAYDAYLHVSLQVMGSSPGGVPVSAPASSWFRIWDAADTPLEETELTEGAGLVLLHRSACSCIRVNDSPTQPEGDEWSQPRPKAAALLQGATASGGGPLALAAARGAAGGASGPPLVRSPSQVDAWFATGGLVGLVNLANTCFLNAAVQCLSAVLPFSRYFLSGAFRADINEQNCMGTQGRLAHAYAKTLRALWVNGEPAFAPRELKWAIGEVREEFLGFAQQDSQELLAFLLDGLHEDLNRVRKKPYYEDKIEGAAGANDSTIALRSWQRHKEIHDSIVVDLFQGQYRSQLVCPLCHRLSVTFDPFLNLSLPLPHAASLRFNVAGNFEVSKAFAAEMQVKLPLSQAKAKDLALRLVRAAMKDELPQATLMEEEKEELHRQICHSTGIHSLEELKEDHILLICRRPGEMSPGAAQLVNGLKAFSPGDELRSKTEKKLTTIFVWFLPSRIVQELEGVCREQHKGQDFAAEEPVASATTMPPDSDSEGSVSSSSNTSSSISRNSSCISERRLGANGSPAVCDGGGCLQHRLGVPLQAIAKKRRSVGLPLSLAASNSFFVFVAPLVKYQGEARVHGSWMPVLRLVTSSTTCSDLYAAVESSFFSSPGDGCGDAHTPTTPLSHADDQLQQKSKISGVFTQAVEAINKTFGPSNADPHFRKWRLQVAYPFAAEDPERSVLGQGVAYLRDKLGGQLRIIPNEDKPLTQHVRPVKGQFMALVYLDLSAVDHLVHMSSSGMDQQGAIVGGILSLGAVRQSHKINLSDCLQLFAEREILDQDNMWYCGTCRKHVQAQKKLDLWRMPRVLILHLKRFHSVNRWSRSKISTRVCFPYKADEYLDMSRFILPGGLQQLQQEDPKFTPEYELIGVNVHSGELGGGHYYAYTKIRGQWYEFNDSCVTPVHEDKCHSADAYMLTYELRSSREDSKRRMANVDPARRAAAASHQHQHSSYPW